MDNLQYYKSLVSDDEVINALIRDSKAREGLLEKSRIRPNLNFFQRTVSNLVTSNKRVSDKQQQIIEKEKEKNKLYRTRKIPVRKKSALDYIKEIISNKIEFVKDSGSSNTAQVTNIVDLTQMKTSSLDEHSTQNERRKRLYNQRKSPFQQIREILTTNAEKTAAINAEKRIKHKNHKNKSDDDVDSVETLSTSVSDSDDDVVLMEVDAGNCSDSCKKRRKTNNCNR